MDSVNSGKTIVGVGWDAAGWTGRNQAIAITCWTPGEQRLDWNADGCGVSKAFSLARAGGLSLAALFGQVSAAAWALVSDEELTPSSGHRYDAALSAVMAVLFAAAGSFRSLPALVEPRVECAKALSEGWILGCRHRSSAKKWTRGAENAFRPTCWKAGAS